MSRQVFAESITYVDSVTGVMKPANTTEVYVYLAGTKTLAPIFEARSGGTESPNPFVLGSIGMAVFWAVTGDYDIKFHDTILPARFGDYTIGWQSSPVDVEIGAGELSDAGDIEWTQESSGAWVPRLKIPEDKIMIGQSEGLASAKAIKGDATLAADGTLKLVKQPRFISDLTTITRSSGSLGSFTTPIKVTLEGLEKDQLIEVLLGGYIHTVEGTGPTSLSLVVNGTAFLTHERPLESENKKYSSIFNSGTSGIQYGSPSTEVEPTATHPGFVAGSSASLQPTFFLAEAGINTFELQGFGPPLGKIQVAHPRLYVVAR